MASMIMAPLVALLPVVYANCCHQTRHDLGRDVVGIDQDGQVVAGVCLLHYHLRTVAIGTPLDRGHHEDIDLQILEWLAGFLNLLLSGAKDSFVSLPVRKTGLGKRSGCLLAHDKQRSTCKTWRTCIDSLDTHVPMSILHYTTIQT